MCSPGKEFPVSCTLLPAPCLPDWPWQQPLLAAQALRLSQQGLNLPAQDGRDELRVRSCWCCTPASPALAVGPEPTCGTSRGQKQQNMGTSSLFSFWQKCNKKQSFHGGTGSSQKGGKEGRATNAQDCSTWIIFIGNISGAPVTITDCSGDTQLRHMLRHFYYIKKFS